MPGSGLYTFENMVVSLESEINPPDSRMVSSVLFNDAVVEHSLLWLARQKKES